MSVVDRDTEGTRKGYSHRDERSESVQQAASHAGSHVLTHCVHRTTMLS